MDEEREESYQCESYLSGFACVFNSVHKSVGEKLSGMVVLRGRTAHSGGSG